MDIVFFMNVTKSPYFLLEGFTLPPISTPTLTLPKIKLTSDTVSQLTKPLDVAKNMFLLPISENGIGFPKTLE